MGTLIKKELVSLFCSPVAISFSFVFLLATGLMNWTFGGSFNIPDAGYANLGSFFGLASIIFIILIPALAMRSFSEEKSTKSMNVFHTRPVSVTSLYISKFLAMSVVVLLTLTATLVYVYSVYTLGHPVGNVDLNEIASSYVSLFLLSLVFIAVGLFSSALTGSQIIAFIIAVFLNVTVFYGFDLLGSLFSGGKTQLLLSSFGMNSHYQTMQKGVIGLNDILAVFNYIVALSVFTIFILNLKNKRNTKQLITSTTILLLFNLIFLLIPDIRFDFTSDKRYTLTDYTKERLKDIASEGESVRVNVYLEGDLNPGFQHLQNAVKDILTDFNRYADGRIKSEYIDVYASGSNEQIYGQMAQQDMRGIALNEVSRDGKASRKIIYPYAQVIMGGDTLVVNLLKNVAGYTADENLNASVENLEFEFVDAIRLLGSKDVGEIAFIEGHGEIPRAYVYDAEELLSKYFFVNRGLIMNDVSVLNNFKVIIIAGATRLFNEREKFILDQYIMSGGRVLWLIDGVYLSRDDLAQKGESASIKNETNLDDLLFTYGVRINPVLLQDVQSSSILLTSGESASDGFIETLWYYSPLLLPSLDHPVTKDVSLVKSQFVSSIDVTDKSQQVKKSVLLTTSARTHTVKVPEAITLDLSSLDKTNQSYFNQSYLPVAIALQGTFSSAFVNRMIPDSVNMNGHETKHTSGETKMIVVSTSDLIRNEIVGYDDETQVLPMGYDRVSGKQYGNRDFIVNAVNWLANDNEWVSLKSKQQQIRLLDKQTVYSQKNSYTVLNIAVPLIFILIVIGSVYFIRKYRYER